MNTRLHRIGWLSLAALAVPAAALAAKTSTDVMPPLRRQVSVKLAHGFANPPAPAPVPADLPSPFNPSEFDKPDPGDGKGGAPNGGSSPGGADRADKSGKPPAGDRAILEAVAARIPATGMITMRGKPMLAVSGGKRVSVGDTFTVTYGDQDYDLEVVAIERTTFTLRYRGEEITRAIRLTK